MGITLGWVALLIVAGATGERPAERNAAPIAYTVKMVEAEGVGWRAGVMNQLRPVARQGASTVWTLPRSAGKKLIQDVSKNRSASAVQTSRVIAQSGVPAAIQVRQNLKFVTQVSWDGADAALERTPEDLRVGWHTTIVGRKLDQGILVKMVFEDTEIRGVHAVKLAAPPDVNKANSVEPRVFGRKVNAAGPNGLSFEGSPFDIANSSKTRATDAPCCDKACADECDSDAPVKTKIKSLMDKATAAYAQGRYVECEELAERALEVDPELSAEIQILVHKAKVEQRFKADKDRIGKVETMFQRTLREVDAASEATNRATLAHISVDHASPENRMLELPEIANQEILGEWLIPKGECLLVSFGPHTVADKDGKAVVRERLAFVEVDEQAGIEVKHRAVMAAPLRFIPPPPPIARPAAPTSSDVHSSVSELLDEARKLNEAGEDLFHQFSQPPPISPHRMSPSELKAKEIDLPPPVAGLPTLATPPAPDAKLPMPAVPSRSVPEGIHADGTKAKLPPLPDDEMDDDSADSESAEPRPSPQTKKPRKPEPEVDESATKASFTKPNKSSTFFLPSLFLPGASVGFQFLLPIGPLSLKLPFNQRLEIEIFGRIVPDKRPSDDAK